MDIAAVNIKVATIDRLHSTDLTAQNALLNRVVFRSPWTDNSGSAPRFNRADELSPLIGIPTEQLKDYVFYVIHPVTIRSTHGRQ